MPLLLPYHFKKIGLLITPIGLSLWLAMQKGLINTLLSDSTNPELINVLNTASAVVGFFSVLLGLYFLAFSKEKIEDEMIHQLRVESFQFAALLQIIFLITGFATMLFTREPDKEGMLLFFVLVLLVFWTGFILRFNFIVHRLKNQ